MTIERHKPNGFIKLGCVALTLSLLGLSTGQSAVITVDETADDDPSVNNGLCSLREAILSANSDSAVDGCATGAGPDTIELPAGTYVLSRSGASENASQTGDLDLLSDLTINGQDVDTTTIDANDIDRIFHAAASNITVHLNRLTITNGTAPSGEHGGAVHIGLDDAMLVNIEVNLADCAVTNSATLGSTDDGGGLHIQTGGAPADCTGCTLNIVDSTVSGNTSADRGGGIYNNGETINLTNTTVSGNVAADDGGGILSTGTFSVLTINNSTIVDNTTADGGGGIDAGSGSIVLHNTILADNSSGSGEHSCQGSITANFSLIETTTGCTVSGSDNVTGMDPNLGPLAYNGGPGMQTHALLAGSLAIDSGETGAGGCTTSSGGLLSVDQRNAPRAQGGGAGGASCDMGAYEFDAGMPVTLFDFSVD